MNPTDTYYTARELAGKTGLPKTESAVIRRAKRESWQGRKRQGRGGGVEYHISVLPETTRAALLDEQIAASPETVCPISIKEQTPLPAVQTQQLQELATMKTWQQQVMDARLIIIRLIEKAEPEFGVTKAIRKVVEKAQSNELPEEVARLIPTANARGGKTGKRTLSERTLMRWWSTYLKADRDYRSLAPAVVEKNDLPRWAGDFLKIYQQPQKLSVPHALSLYRQNLPAGERAPSEQAVRRFLAKYSRLEIQKGRMTASELRGQKMHRVRSTEGMQPLDIVQCDGHSFKARVAHPATGRPFKPEICAVVDSVTRCVVGWSVGLAESATTVGDAVRHSCTTNDTKVIGGLPLILYTDKGAGNMAAVNADEIAGLYSRLGITHKTGRPGNPQGRGLVERLNASLWIPAAKELITYTGNGMDTAIARKVYLALDADVRKSKRDKAPVRSEILPTWPQFIDHLEQCVERYHHTPHSSLPKITDAGGKRRHMTPYECWGTHLHSGWLPQVISEKELAHIARPHEMATVTRGNVRLHGKSYGDPVLEHYNTLRLPVAYDIHDPSHVWVKDAEGRTLVKAKLDYNKGSFFSKDEIDKARRHANRTRTAAAKIDEIDAEYYGDGSIETTATDISQDVIETADTLIEKHESKKTTAPLPMNNLDVYNLLAAEKLEGKTLTEKELAWMNEHDHFMLSGKKGRLLKADWQPFAERNKKAKEAKE